MTLAQRLSTAFLIAVTTVAASFTILVVGGSATLDVQLIRVVFLVMAALALLPWLAGARVAGAGAIEPLAPALSLASSPSRSRP